MINLVVVTVLSRDGDTQRTLDLARWSIVSAGVWWAAFTLLPLRWLKEHPGGAAAAAGRRQRAHRRVPAARAHDPQHPGVPADLVLPARVPDLQRRHPDGHRAGQPVRHRGAAPGAVHPDHHDPDRAVPGVRRGAAAGRAGRPDRRPQDGAAQPGAVARRDPGRVLAARGRTAAVHAARRRRSAW